MFSQLHVHAQCFTSILIILLYDTLIHEYISREVWPHCIPLSVHVTVRTSRHISIPCFITSPASFFPTPFFIQV